AATVLAALEPWFGVEDAPRLRRRTRRLLARVCPDLLRQRAVRARSESALRRWVDEPGVDTWLGTFPSEEACRAWAAVDALAQRYVTDGVCERIDRARAKALTDLVTGQATIDVEVVLTTAATAAIPATATAATAIAHAAPPARPALAPDPAVVTPATAAGDLVEVTGPAAADPVLVPRGWLDDTIRATTTKRDPADRDSLGRPRVVPCHPGTGALTDPGDALATTAYRPGTALTALVRARDRHCRFPGCHVAARFCDLDHVTPWPTGPTTAINLATLCRRHHRTKQRPGWRAVLHPDATMTWTDPTGRHRTTHPTDQRHHATLPDTGTDPTPPAPGTPSLAVPDGPHSPLDFTLEHHLRGALTAPRCRVDLHDLRSRPGPAIVRIRCRDHRRRPPPPDAPPY
uniref:HNH endonuclease signature motif containing protein n=2 Tax=uncultured Phycicoccus sp. TaxID=661422 RepID=UPI00262AB081